MNRDLNQYNDAQLRDQGYPADHFERAFDLTNNSNMFQHVPSTVSSEQNEQSEIMNTEN